MTNPHTLNLAKIRLIAAAILTVAGPVAIGVFGALRSRGQSQAVTAPPAFEAASVKLHLGGISRGERTHSIEPGRLTWFNANLSQFIEMAYGVKHYQVSGPDWIVNFGSSDRYDVVATAGSPVSAEEVKRMLGPLLAERFHLALHRETRELPVFELVVAKGGPKFKAGDGGALSMSPDGEGGTSYKNWPMATFVNWLSGLPSVGRPVIDRTGLEGIYSFTANLFDFPREMGGADMKAAVVNGDAGGAIFSTLPQQLGLKLEAQKAAVEILVIDHADKVPTEN
jgi:uncharacterized protein (TIGR03435 family)